MGQLVLHRREGERVMIDKDIVVTVLEINAGAVKLGFEAPAEIAIDREEIRKRKDAEKDNGNQIEERE